MEPTRLDGNSRCICGKSHAINEQHTLPCKIYRNVAAHLRAAGKNDPANILETYRTRMREVSTT